MGRHHARDDDPDWLVPTDQLDGLALDDRQLARVLVPVAPLDPASRFEARRRLDRLAR